MRILAVVLVSSLLTMPVKAAVPAPMSDCTIDLAADQEAYAIGKEEAEIARIRGPLLQQTLDLIRNYPSNSKKPLSEIMSPNDLVRFTEIRDKLVFTSIQDYLVSEHARDINAIVVMWHNAVNSAYGIPTPEGQYKNEKLLEGLLRAVTDKLLN